MANETPCPDRTNQYLLSLQTKYRVDSITDTKLEAAVQNQIVAPNPFRVFLSFSIAASAKVDIYFIDGNGVLVFYQTATTLVNITVTQQLHFLLPSFEWVCIPTAGDHLTGTSIVKT